MKTIVEIKDLCEKCKETPLELCNECFELVESAEAVSKEFKA